jgi:hypothetical protein
MIAFRYCDLNRQNLRSIAQIKSRGKRSCRAFTGIAEKRQQYSASKKQAPIASLWPTIRILGTWAVGGIAANAVPIMTHYQNAVGTVQILFTKGANITDDPVLAKNTGFGKTYDRAHRSNSWKKLSGCNKADIELR